RVVFRQLLVERYALRLEGGERSQERRHVVQVGVFAQGVGRAVDPEPDQVAGASARGARRLEVARLRARPAGVADQHGVGRIGGPRNVKTRGGEKFGGEHRMTLLRARIWW